MATKIVLKNGSGAPLASDLVQGEVGLDLTNKRIYTEDSGGTVIEMGTSPSTIDINAGTVDGISSLSTANGTDVSFAGVSATKFFWDASAESLTVGNASALTNTAGFNTVLGLKGNLPAITVEDTGTGTGKYTLGVTSGNFGVWDNTRSAYLLYGDSSGNVGIGTSSPTTNLDGLKGLSIDGGATGSGVAVGSSTHAYLMYTAASVSDSLAFWDSTLNTERMRIDSSGNLLVGKTTTAFATAGTTLYSDGLLEVTRADRPLRLNRTGTDGSIAEFYKDGTTVGSIGCASSGTDIYFGTDTAAGIRCSGAAVYPATAGSGADNTYNLGASAVRWATVYAATALINTSDEREKTPLEDLDAAELAVAKELKAAIKKFKFKDAVEAKGEAARLHVGVGAQTVKAIFESHGLVAEDYAILCYDEWDAEFDEDGNETRPAGSRYGVRYEELLAFIIAAI